MRTVELILNMSEIQTDHIPSKQTFRSFNDIIKTV